MHSTAPNSRTLAALAVLVLWLALVLRPTVPGRYGPPMRDFEAYYGAGAAYDAGRDPYSRAVWDAESHITGVDPSHDELLPFVSPAPILPPFGLIARTPYEIAHRIWGGILGLALGIALFGMLALFRAPFRWETLAGSLLLSLSFGPLTSDVALGQIALFGLTGVVIATLALEHRTAIGAAAGAFIAAVQPNLAIVLCARVRDLRSILALGLGCAAFIGAALATHGGVDGLIAYARLLHEHGAGERFIAIQQTPVAIAWELGLSQSVASIAGSLISLVALVVLIVCLRRTSGSVERVALACCALPFVLPFFHEHDFLIALFPAFLVAIRGRGTVLTAGAIGTTIVAIDWLGFGQRAGGIPQSLMMTVAAALGFALLAPAQGRERLAGLIVCVAAIPIALGALLQPVPIWPDMLPAAFHLPASADASAVWHAEQATSGLERQAPMWALLKLCTFAGCASLWAAVVALGRAPISDVDVHEVVERPELVGMKAG